MINQKNNYLKIILKEKNHNLTFQNRELFRNLTKKEITKFKKERTKKFRKGNKNLLDRLKTNKISFNDFLEIEKNNELFLQYEKLNRTEQENNKINSFLHEYIIDDIITNDLNDKMSIFDIGSGIGFFERALCKKLENKCDNLFIEGCEPAKKNYNYFINNPILKKNNNTEIIMHNQSFLNVETSKKFDFVSSIYVFHYILSKDFEEVAKKINSLLKMKGKFILVTINYDYINNEINKTPDMLLKKHTIQFDDKNYEELLHFIDLGEIGSVIDYNREDDYYIDIFKKYGLNLSKKIDLNDSGYLSSIFVFEKTNEFGSGEESKRYETNPITTENIFESYDKKYGEFDYSINERAVIPELFKKTFIELTEDVIKKSNNVIITGVNSGYEVGIIKEINPDIEIVGVDLSKTALKKLKEKYDLDGVVCDMQKLPYKDNSFDCYVSLRSIHSSCIDIKTAINEAKRFTKKGGEIILSISNGYFENGKIIKGMYDYENKLIDKEKPNKIAQEVSSFFVDAKVCQIDSEIFIIAKNI